MALSVLGVDIHVLDRGAGEPLLFLHGNPDSSDAWEGVIDHLGEGYRCIAPDWPGFGRSQPAPDFDYSLSGHARFVAALLDALAVSEPVTVIGHDFGGVFGCAFAVEHEARVRRLVMMKRMNSAAVCQPDAHSPPNSDASAAASSRWKGCGSNSRAKAITSSRVKPTPSQ